ncbi:MAG: M16 family metallopeptidase [Candidatus Cryptobacteroides sp.]
MICGKTGCGLSYAVKKSGSAVGYCALSIKCGTRDEAGYHSGIAHFAEHTMFKGTKKKNASTINSYLDRLGGELNAYTTKEEIVLHATVLKEDLGKAASLLLELATSPTFPQNEIATEKGVVIDEINSYKDSPAEDVYDRFEELLFEGHPLSGPILGTANSVRKITTEELLKFVKEKFTPERMALTVVAGIDEKSLEKKVLALSEKFFGNGTAIRIEGSETERIQSGSAEDSENKENKEGTEGYRRDIVRTDGVEWQPFDKTVNKRNHQVNCVIGGMAPSLYEERQRLATVLLCNILGGPATNSILNSILREKNGWVYGVECSYTQYADTGIVAICLGCDKENLDKCLKSIDKEIAKLQAEPMSATKLKAAKKQLLGQLAISSDNGETQCLSMGKSLLAYGRVTPSDLVREKLEGITAEELMYAARAIFAKDRISKLVFM